MTDTNWLPGIIVGLAGLLLGVVVLFLTKKQGPSRVPDAALRDLETRVNLLLEQLRSLEADRHQLGDDAFAQEKRRLELEAAGAMRARDEHRQKAAAAQKAQTASGPQGTAAAAPQGFFARNPQLKGALWGGGMVVFAMGVFLVLQNAQRDRGANDQMTGGMAGGPAQMQQEPQLEDDPMFKQAYDRVRANPQDAEASALVVHELIRAQRFEEAAELTGKALAANPFHVESRVHNEVLRAATRGEFKEAIAGLGELARAYPDSNEALLFRGALAMEVSDSQAALESFEKFAQQTPAEQQPPQLQETIAMLRQRVSAAPAKP